ncbi:deoxynucleoside kinase [candidate division KSB1 bacterium]|nr:deoxynucleoside kinase [candidate division KSB1 bacterium]
MSRNYFFALAGNIGVGKTTWTNLLSDRFSWHPFYEKVVENPYLSDFYSDMSRWSFHSQIFFLTQRFKENNQIQNTRKTCIQDRTIFEDAEIFAYNLFRQQIMPERDYLTYRELYDSMLSSIRYPDLMIYLRASTWTLISRIRKRGRDYERRINKEYLAQLNILYDTWIHMYAQSHRALIVETDNFDIEKDTGRLKEIIREISAYEHQLELFPQLSTI